jgi:hypothetical protein
MSASPRRFYAHIAFFLRRFRKKYRNPGLCHKRIAFAAHHGMGGASRTIAIPGNGSIVDMTPMETAHYHLFHTIYPQSSSA